MATAMLAPPKPAPPLQRPSQSWNRLNLLLVLVPTAILLDWQGVNPSVLFFLSALAIVPLSGMMGRATENISSRVGTA